MAASRERREDSVGIFLAVPVRSFRIRLGNPVESTRIFRVLGSVQRGYATLL